MTDYCLVLSQGERCARGMWPSITNFSEAKMKVYLLIVKEEKTEELITVQVFSTAEIARKHSNEWLRIYNDVTAEVRPQVVGEE